MFNFKKDVKKELNKIWAEIYSEKTKRIKQNEWIDGFDERLAGIQNEIQQIEINYGDTIHNLCTFKEKIEKAIPTFNKMIENQNEMNTYIKGSTKLFQRIIKFIKLPKIETKGK